MCLAIALDIVPSSTCKGFGSDGRIWNVGLCPMSVATTSDLSIVSSTDPREDRMDIPCTSPRFFKTAGGSITRLCACAIPSSWVWSAMDFPLASRCPSHPPLPSMSSCVLCCWPPSSIPSHRYHARASRSCGKISMRKGDSDLVQLRVDSSPTRLSFSRRRGGDGRDNCARLRRSRAAHACIRREEEACEDACHVPGAREPGRRAGSARRDPSASAVGVAWWRRRAAAGFPAHRSRPEQVRARFESMDGETCDAKRV